MKRKVYADYTYLWFTCRRLMRLFYDVYYPLLRTFIPVAVEGMLDYKANMELYLEKI